MFNLLTHEIRSRWRAILGWGFGLILFGAVYISIAPGLFEQMKFLKDLSVYKLVGMQLGSIEGYMASVILVYASILLGVAAVFYVLALICFSRRNITVGAWPWQRGKITD